MNNNNRSKVSLLLSIILLSFSASTYALADREANTNSVVIPMITNAQVFAKFTDELPAVVNYFTRATQEQIIDFYQQHYGEFLSQEKKRGRSTLTYQHKKQRVRVVISEQNSKRQVDIIVELKDK